MSKKKRKRARQPKNSNSSAGASPQNSPTPEAPPSSSHPGSDNLEVHRTTISQYVSFGLLLGVIALFSFLFYEVMAKFLVPLFLAALLVVVFRPIHEWIIERVGGREQIGALLTTGVVLLVVLVPIGLLLVMAAAEGRHFVKQFNTSQVIDGLGQIRTKLGLDMPSPEELRTIESEIDELERDSKPGEAVADQHRTSLYSMVETAKSLAKAQGLAWPVAPAVDENSDPPDESPWVSFVHDLEDARAMHNSMDWSGRNDLDRGGQRQDLEEQRLEQQRLYWKKINALAGSFAEFRTQLLGGKAKAPIIQLVNPSDAQASAYISDGIDFIQDKVLKLSGAGAAFVGNLLLSTAIMVIGLYFFLLDGPKMIEAFKGLSPIDDEHEQELVVEFSNISRAVVLATLLSALAQGLLAGIGFYFAGLDSVFLLTVMTAVLAMVPFVGAAAVWVPCAFYLYFVEQNLTAAIALAVYGAAIISMADNIIKPYVLHGQSNIHPLLALLSVLGGVTTLGPIGILVGPMVVAFLQTLLKILQREMSNMDQESGNAQPTR